MSYCIFPQFKQNKSMHSEIKICEVKNKEHEDKLLEVAKWLDDTTFSCTFSIIDGIAHFDIDAADPDFWDQDRFEKFSSQEVLSALAKFLV